MLRGIPRGRKGERLLEALTRIESSSFLDNRTKKSIGLKMKNVLEAKEKIEQASGISYPPYYIEPVLTVVPPTGNVIEGLGVFYARTIPVQVEGKVRIVVELAAPLLLYSTKTTLRLVMAHELLHYVELVMDFTRMDIATQITSSSIFEDRFSDSSRAVDPAAVFNKDKRLARALAKKLSAGLEDQKLNEKCRTRWIEKGMPVVKRPIGTNQVSVPVEAIMRSEFDPKVKELAARIRPVMH